VSKNDDNNDNEEAAAYNQYVLSDGIWAKLDAKIDQQIRTEILDRIYTRTRERIKEKGGLITHDDAMKFVLKEDKQKILDDMLNDRLDDFGKEYPLLAENLRSKDDEQKRDDTLRVIHSMLEEMEDPNR
jgi:hypothetical protein